MSSSIKRFRRDAMLADGDFVNISFLSASRFNIGVTCLCRVRTLRITRLYLIAIIDDGYYLYHDLYDKNVKNISRRSINSNNNNNNNSNPQ